MRQAAEHRLRRYASRDPLQLSICDRGPAEPPARGGLQRAVHSARSGGRGFRQQLPRATGPLSLGRSSMSAHRHWVGTWTATPAPAEGAAFANHTLRMTPRVSIGGSVVRVRISNAYGVHPLRVG